ncbi:DegT/DnrJ/EryC1/StrS family aminotransferase [Nitrospinae bacterium AH_259_B05_G02_I21]|nr:DegT/DnrJ/EryC1/StrS family aminotransferase [Nitrospinae bacterium AH_259_B05_G02_I21]
MRIPLSKPWITEDEARQAAEVVASGWLISGPKTEAFEDRFAKAVGVSHAVAVNSGSSALLVALAALGVEPGDEVIVPNMTFIATASAALFLGARPLFADIEPHTYGLDPNDLEHRITPRTRGIIPVHYAGQTAEMGPILEVAHAHGLFVLEDAAESHLARYGDQPSGGMGHMGIFSFTPSKLITTGEGGMITTNEPALAERARLIRNFGDTGKFAWELLGYNFRMPEVAGAVGLVQLEKLEEAASRRRAIAQTYTEAFTFLPALQPPYVRNLADHVFQLYTVLLDLEQLTISRDEVIQALEKQGVASRLYYPCLHRQRVFEARGLHPPGPYPQAETFERRAFSLPIYPTMTEAEVHYVIETVTTVIETHRR